ncbi:FAD-binding oxidoreductase [Candidatus Parcubacteria bacterium]|nr:FAD-binding oxidoreductase [Candidatus Parcubacteria bacterium]
MTNNSPWIHQLDHSRKRTPLPADLLTDVAVIGAGIAGVSTAFSLLKHTDRKVALIEGYKLAHGATGHNAGQMVTYFERPFVEIVNEFGLEMAAQGQKDVDGAWELAQEMYTEAGLDIPMMRFESYSGFSTLAQVLEHLEDDRLRRAGGIRTGTLEIWEEAPFLYEIPEKYRKLFVLVPREEIALKLETLDPQYVALLPEQRGVMNSALFCQEVVRFLSEKYPDRFALYEETPIGKVAVHAEKVLLDAGLHTIECGKVVLCTNGFENIEIFTSSGLEVNSRFHHSLHGVVGYMTGYLEPKAGVPAAIHYYPAVDPGLTDTPGAPYFYVTRRPYEYQEGGNHNLISIGGPDVGLESRAHYDRDRQFSEKAKKKIEDFVRQVYDKKENLEFLFTWHGVMGYTKNMLRMVGPDPSFGRLYYNLGCNGVGLLPSIFGGDKVARQIAGEEFAPSIFDIPKAPRTRAESLPAPALSSLLQ